MYIVYDPDSTGRIGVKVDTHRQMFNPYEDRTSLPQGAQDELDAKFTIGVVALYDKTIAERVIEPEPTPQTTEQIYSKLSRVDKAIIKTIADLHGKSGAQIKALIKGNM